MEILRFNRFNWCFLTVSDALPYCSFGKILMFEVWILPTWCLNCVGLLYPAFLAWGTYDSVGRPVCLFVRLTSRNTERISAILHIDLRQKLLVIFNFGPCGVISIAHEARIDIFKLKKLLSLQTLVTCDKDKEINLIFFCHLQTRKRCPSP
jgi:hypothetical protein